MRKIKAEADLLVQLAEAERVRLKNESLKGIGSERMVGLKMADVYKGARSDHPAQRRFQRGQPLEPRQHPAIVRRS